MSQHQPASPYKCVLSIGMRCYTEIYLKQMGLKKFSGPFDALYSHSVENIIYLLENKINQDDLIHTELMNQPEIQSLNRTFGYRTIHKKLNFYDERDLSRTYHLASFAHHNLNNIETRTHFDRCFERLDKIKNEKIKTLFCLFSHPNGKSDKFLSQPDISTICRYLSNNFNCHVLIIVFMTFSQSDFNSWKVKFQNDMFTYIVVNNGSIEFTQHKNNLQDIFSYMGVKDENLFTYNNMKTSL